MGGLEEEVKEKLVFDDVKMEDNIKTESNIKVESLTD
jgi:hypothetical protein